MVSKFIKVRCEGCKNEQIIFGKPAGEVNCLICGKVLAKSTGGQSRIEGKIVDILK